MQYSVKMSVVKHIVYICKYDRSPKNTKERIIIRVPWADAFQIQDIKLTNDSSFAYCKES
jgi:hypothetical protein